MENNLFGFNSQDNPD